MYKMCDKCGFFYDDVENSQCPQCGAGNDSGTSIGEQPVEINEDNSVKCPNCGYKLDEENCEFCPICLFPINQTETEQENIDEPHEILKNRVPNENEHICPNCGNIQSKSVHRCLKCSELIEDEKSEFVDSVDSIGNGIDENNDNDVNDIDDIDNEPELYTGNETISDVPQSYETLSNTSNDSQYSSDNSQSYKNLSNYKKVAVIVLVVILLLSLTSVAFISNRNKPIEIDLYNYISSDIYTDEDVTSEDYFDEYDPDDEVKSYYMNYSDGAGLRIYGYNEYASFGTRDMVNIIDWDSLQRDIDEQLSHKRKYEKRYLEFYDFFDVNSFDFSADYSENISNGDSICITVNTEESYTFNNVTINISSCSYTYDIEGLKTVEAFDPFDYVTFIQYNANEYASAGCRVNEDLNENIDSLDGFKVTYYNSTTIAIEEDDYIIAKIEFYFDDDTESYHNYKNGETVTMYCSCSNDDLTEDYDIYIGTYQKDYTFTDLGEYVTKSSTISNNELKKFTDYSKKLIKKQYSGYDCYSNFKLNSAYITDLKDRTEDTSYHNNLCLIYSYTYENSWNDEKETKYLYVMFNDLIISSLGKIEFTPEDYYDRINNDYDSVDEILSYCFGDSYNVVKI